MTAASKTGAQSVIAMAGSGIGAARRWLALGLLLSLLGLAERIPQAYGVGSLLGGWSGSRLLHAVPLALLALVFAGLLGLAFRDPRWLLSAARRGLNGLRRLGGVNGVLFGLCLLAFAWLVSLSSLGARAEAFFPRLVLLGYLALAGALYLRAAWRGGTLDLCVALALLGAAAVYRAALFLPELGSYPLTMGWSEASRFYYASLFAAGRVYGEWFPLPTLHPTRYLLQSLPFLIPALGLSAHRLWQVLLWLGMAALGGWALARRLKLDRRALTVAVALWAFLFAFVGPVYYHLMVIAAIVLLGYDSRRPWRSLLVVLAASLWAGISRVNWFPMPGLLAAALYVMEQPAAGRKFWRYWAAPVAYAVIGLAVALGAQAAYAVISRNPLEQFSSSLTSDLLWYRLFPNATYGPGILRAILWASLPPLGVMAALLALRPRAWRALRLLDLAAMLAALFAGGLVVSVKIGGGSNLHNMDAYLTLLMVVVAYAAFDRIAPDDPARSLPAWTGRGWAQAVAWLWLAFALLNPIAPVARAGGPLPQWDNAAASRAISALQKELDGVDGEVLFISNRQLVAFHSVSGVRMVPEYERVFLMEMAMAGNRPYLDTFHNDLARHRFALIITEPEGEMIKDQSYEFAEENNVWVEQVARPLYAAYREKALLEGRLQVLEPKP